MRKKRHNGRLTTKTSIEDEIAHLRGLDLTGLRARWQSVFQRPPPDYLPRHLLFAIVAYRVQADHFGDLDHETRQVLDRADSKENGATMSARLMIFDGGLNRSTQHFIFEGQDGVQRWIRAFVEGLQRPRRRSGAGMGSPFPAGDGDG